MTLNGRWSVALIVALGLSLALNFAWLGFSVSRSFRHKPPEISAERLVSIGARSLPPELRAEVATALRAERDDLRAAMRAVGEARRQVFEAMRAEPFDRTALQAAFSTLRQKRDALSSIGEAAIATGLAAASPETRAAIATPRGPRSQR